MRATDLMTELREDYLDDTLGVDDNDSLVSEAALLRFASDAQIQAGRRMDDLIYDETTPEHCTATLVYNQASYALSSKLTRILRVSINGNDLSFKTEYELGQMDASWRASEANTPTHYYVRGRKIFLYPAPDAATAAAYTLDLAVERLPSALSNKLQSFEIPEEAQQDLIYWMLYRVYNKRDEDLFDPDKAAAYKTMFEDMFGKVVPMDIRIHQLESNRIMQHLTGDYTFSGGSEADPDFDSTGWS